MESTLTALKQKIGDFYTEVRTGQWTDYSPQTLVHELKQAKNHLNEIQTSLNSNQNPAEFSDLEKEVHQMIELLSRNIELEEQKGMHDFSSINETEVQGNAEHVWDIQRKLIGLALKTKLKLSENTGIQTREDLKKMYGKQASNTLAELLNQREDELIHLQKEFHELNRKSYLGLIQEKSLADHEEDWTQTRVDLEKMKELLEHGFNEYGKQMMRLQKSFFELKREKNKLEHALDKFGEKNTELVQGLKKERDYSKKILIQSLPETMKLRKMYSKEIMKLEHAKIRIQKEQREKFGKALE
ncbi:MAG: hypothetical protein Q7S92_04270, partial [Candidatus Diapherotrites archaeon]|nr:hypothetical protein [Candidatus Diapherotrites archaeon]